MESKSAKSVKSNILACFVLCLASGLISVHLKQDDSWDLQNYHFYNAFTLLHPCRWHDFGFAQIQTFLNPVLDVPLYLLTVFFPNASRAVAFCMGLPFGVLAFFSFRLSFRLFKTWSFAVPAAVFGLTGSAAVSQIGLSSNEVLVAALITAALDIQLGATSVTTYAAAGLLAGLAAGGKLTAAPYTIGLAAALFAAPPARRVAPAFMSLVVGGLAGLLLTGGFWIAHLVQLYGNPIFPYANQIFRSAWAGPYGYNDARFFPRSAFQALFYPFWWVHKNRMIVGEAVFADARLAAVFIAAPLGLAAAIRHKSVPPPAWRALIAFWLTSYVLWEKSFSIYRYTIPLEVTSGILVVGALRALAPSRRSLTAGVAAGLTVFICYTTVYPNWGHIPFQEQSVPLNLPPLEPHSLVIAIDNNGVSFIALAASPTATFIGVNNNFVVPDDTLAWRHLTSTIAKWPGPVDIIEPVSGDLPARTDIAAVYNLVATNACQPIISALNHDSLHLCTAQRLPGPPPYQPDLSFVFADSGNAASIRRAGWAPAEVWGDWSNREDATLTIPVNPINRRPFLVTALAYGDLPPGQANRLIDVYANGVFLTMWRLTEVPTFYTARTPATPGVAQLNLRFHVPDRTLDLGIGVLVLTLHEIIK